MNKKRSRRAFFRTCGPAAAIAIGTTAGRCDATSTTAVPARKDLAFLRAKAIDGRVRLTAYKSTPALKDKAAQARFREIRVYRREESDFTFGEDYAEYFDGLTREELGPMIAAAFAKLDDDYRTILVLREIEQFDYQTIAKILCVKIGTVRSRLHRARMQMRKLLDVSA